MHGEKLSLGLNKFRSLFFEVVSKDSLILAGIVTGVEEDSSWAEIVAMYPEPIN